MGYPLPQTEYLSPPSHPSPSLSQNVYPSHKVAFGHFSSPNTPTPPLTRTPLLYSHPASLARRGCSSLPSPSQYMVPLSPTPSPSQLETLWSCGAARAVCPLRSCRRTFLLQNNHRVETFLFVTMICIFYTVTTTCPFLVSGKSGVLEIIKVSNKFILILFRCFQRYYRLFCCFLSTDVAGKTTIYNLRFSG